MLYLSPTRDYIVSAYLRFRMNMRGWQIRTWKNIIHVAERAFVAGASTLSVSQETLESAPFAIPTEVAKQKKRKLQK